MNLFISMYASDGACTRVRLYLALSRRRKKEKRSKEQITNIEENILYKVVKSVL
jgi:hypothetical protein